jgi:hypothetical protein
MQGRTSQSYEDFFADDDQPRIWQGRDSQTGRPVFHIRPPCGHHGVLSPLHDVEFNRDDTFTVRPNPPFNPGNSNSILCACGWHGYVYSNDWQAV